MSFSRLFLQFNETASRRSLNLISFFPSFICRFVLLFVCMCTIRPYYNYELMIDDDYYSNHYAVITRSLIYLLFSLFLWMNYNSFFLFLPWFWSVRPPKGSGMNVTYIPMGSMQVGPNGELIPTNISFAGNTIVLFCHQFGICSFVCGRLITMAVTQ